MSNYPNMSYCMFENTNRAMDQIIGELAEAGTLEALDLSREERRASVELYDACQAFIKMFEEMVEEQEEVDISPFD